MRSRPGRLLFIAALLSSSGCFALFDFGDFDTDRPILATGEAGEAGDDDVVVSPAIDAAVPFDITVSVADPVVRQQSSFDVHVTLTRRAAFDEAVAIAIASVPGIALAAPISIPRGSREADVKVKVDRPPYGSTKMDISATSGAFGVSRPLVVEVAGKPGTLDLGLADAGFLVTDLSVPVLEDAVMLSDGKIVVLGSETPVVIGRLGTAGALDTSFGDGGVTSSPDAGGPSRGRHHGDRLSAVGDGGVVATGRDCTFAVPEDDCINWTARYTPQGNLAPSWGTGGVVITTFPGGALVRSGDGVVVAGQTLKGAAYTPILSQFLAGGTLDTTFGDAGTSIPDYGFDAAAQTVRVLDAVRRDGGGLALLTSREQVGALRSDGTRDPAFGGGALVASPTSGTPSRLAALPDHRIVSCGVSRSLGGYVVAYRPDGLVDSTFGDGGSIVVPNANVVFATRSVVVTGGALYVATTLDPQGVSVRKFSLQGKPDATFGTAGELHYIPSNGPSADADAILLLDPTSPRIVLVTEQKKLTGQGRLIALMRFWR